MWDTSSIDFFEPNYEYFIPNNTLSFKKRRKINTLWKKYQVTENGRISLFSSLERIKLVNRAIV